MRAGTVEFFELITERSQVAPCVMIGAVGDVDGLGVGADAATEPLKQSVRVYVSAEHRAEEADARRLVDGSRNREQQTCREFLGCPGAQCCQDSATAAAWRWDQVRWKAVAGDASTVRRSSDVTNAKWPLPAPRNAQKSFRCARDSVPGMGSIVGERARSQASAIFAGLAPRRLAIWASAARVVAADSR